MRGSVAARLLGLWVWILPGRMDVCLLCVACCQVAQSVLWLSTGWTGRGSNPGGTRFSAPAQTRSEAHPTTYIMATRSFSGVKWPGRGIDHPPLSSAEVKERVQLHLYSPSGPSWPVLGWNLPLPYDAATDFTLSYRSPWHCNRTVSLCHLSVQMTTLNSD